MFHSVEDVDEIPRLTRLLGKDARKRPKRKTLAWRRVRNRYVHLLLRHSSLSRHLEAPATALTGPGRCMSTPGSNIVKCHNKRAAVGQKGDAVLLVVGTSKAFSFVPL